MLYDPAALAAADALLRDMRWEDAVALRGAVPRLGLEAPWRGGRAAGLARGVVAIAARGLAARARMAGPGGPDEAAYLDPLHAIVAGAPSQAEHWLSRYREAWGGDAGKSSPKPRFERPNAS